MDRPIPRADWGAQHWRMLDYAETLAVARLRVNLRQLRLKPAHTRQLLGVLGVWRDLDNTMLRDGRRAADHDDWDCLLDLDAAELLTILPERRVRLHDEGWTVAQALRRRLAAGGSHESFAGQEEALPGYRLALDKELALVVGAAQYYVFCQNVQRSVGQRRGVTEQEVARADADATTAHVILGRALASYCDLRVERMDDIVRGEQVNDPDAG